MKFFAPLCYNIYMDIEKRARRQSMRIIISEIVMVVAVIVTVSILAFVVSGYWLGSDGKIERQGLLQIYSTPTGADVEVDQNPTSWLQRTNTSKTLSAGQHTIKLTKDNYDSWSRTINISEGLLYRLHYPRLFLKERANESAFDFSGNFATISPDRNTMLLGFNTTTWQTFNLDSDNAKPVPLNLVAILPFTNLTADTTSGLFSGEILQADWATDNEHVLLKIKNTDSINWLILNVKNPANSFNLTKEFNADFSEIKILDGSANNLLAIWNGNLHRIDVPAKQISTILAENVNSFDYYNQDVIFSTASSLSILKLGSGEITELQSITEPVRVVMMKFYDDEYIGVIGKSSIALYLKKDFEHKMTFDLSFYPEEVKVGQGGEFVTMFTGGKIATLDMEAMEVTEWSTDTDKFGWLDGSMIYAVKDGNLNVYDFNGLNSRTLATNVSAHFPVTITSDKYLYYFQDGTLIREYLFEK